MVIMTKFKISLVIFNIIITGINILVVNSVAVSFEVRPKEPGTQENEPTPAPNTGATQPTPFPSSGTSQATPSTSAMQSAPVDYGSFSNTQPAPSTTTGAAQPAPSTSTGAAQPATSTGATQPRITGSPAPLFPELREATAARRNSDDWTILNRESPTRNVEAAAMEMEGNTSLLHPHLYPLLPKETPEDKKIQEAVDMIHYMGFNFDTTMLKEMLKKENCDVASVLEHLLSNKK